MAKQAETGKKVTESISDTAPAATAEKTDPVSIEAAMPTDAELLDLYSAADADTKKAFVALLKGENPQPQDLMAMLADVIGSENVEAMIKNIFNMLSSLKRNKKTGSALQVKKAGAGSLLTFTYLYSLSIYILLLSFYFWQIRTDIKPEK